MLLEANSWSYTFKRQKIHELEFGCYLTATDILIRKEFMRLATWAGKVDAQKGIPIP